MMELNLGKGIVFQLPDTQVETLKSHPGVAAHAFEIGLLNMLKDCHARFKREDFKTDDEWRDESRKASELKLGALMNGEVRAAKVRAPVDSLASYRKKAALAIINATAAGKAKLAGLKGDALAEKIAGFIAKNGDLVETNAAKMRDEEIARRKREDAENAAIEGIDLDF